MPRHSRALLNGTIPPPPRGRKKVPPRPCPRRQLGRGSVSPLLRLPRVHHLDSPVIRASPLAVLCNTQKKISRSHWGCDFCAGEAPFSFLGDEGVGTALPEMGGGVREAGWGRTPQGADRNAGVASGHPAPHKPERRAGRASGKFQAAAAEESLQGARHSRRLRGGGGAPPRDSSGGGWAS